MDQLERFRDLLRRLDPTVPIRQPDEHPWYVERPASVAERVARSLLLEPWSSHLLVGPIGCGKSTELLAIQRHLPPSPDVVFCDVEAFGAIDLDADAQQLGSLQGMLAGSLVGWLNGMFPADERVAKHREQAEAWAANPSLDSGRTLLGELASGACALFRRSRFVWLLDGLDRITSTTWFDELVEPLLLDLRTLGIGVAMVGPRRVISGADRLGAASAFDELHWVAPLDPKDDAEHGVLRELLERRGLGDIADAPEIDALVDWSGGSFRILVQLAREAVKETWVRNEPRMGPDQVRVAADKVGRGMLLGLSDRDMTALERLKGSGTFARRAPEDDVLVLTNRVLEYRDQSGLVRHALHPTLVPIVVRSVPANTAPSRKGPVPWPGRR